MFNICHFYSLQLVSREVLTVIRVEWKVLSQIILNMCQIMLVVEDVNRSFVFGPKYSDKNGHLPM